MRTIAVIPARLASSRYYAKPLALLCGDPLIKHVYQNVLNTLLFDEVIVATDADEIADCVHNFGGKVCMTSAHHQSGSDRIAEVVANIDVDIVVNVQGDEPFISREPLHALIRAFIDTSVEVASLMTKINDPLQLINSNIVKVVIDSQKNALYFSRSSIPFNRDNISGIDYFRHVGVYAFRKKTLLEFVGLPIGTLEQIEKLEQLRLLENSISIRMIETDYQGVGIDTPTDLIAAEKLLLSNK